MSSDAVTAPRIPGVVLPPAQQPYPVTGVTLGGTYPRLEIRDLVKKPEQFTLFILAYMAIREPSYQPVAARFVQQAGIHGLPYQQWPGDPQGPSKPNAEDNFGGYCTHESVLFPTWHRACMLLMEQSISRAALPIAARFAELFPFEADIWIKAANELRFPFWDWTLPITGKEGLPHIFYDKELSLRMPGGQVNKVPNILAFYEFGPTRPEGFRNMKQEGNSPGLREAYYKDWDRTYRWPSSEQKPKENYVGLNQLLKDKSKDKSGTWKYLSTKIATLFCTPSNVPSKLNANVWDGFSNVRFESAEDSKDVLWRYAWYRGSIEDPHNAVHSTIGDIGHMGDTDYAGFDPIFFLHHCNIDRILAYWEYVYPNYWLGMDGYLKPDGTCGQFTQSGGTFVLPNEGVINELTGLTPFRKIDKNYWTSKDTQTITQNYPKHYNYPPIDGVVIDECASASQRERDRAKLQKHFGLDFIKLRSSVHRITHGPFAAIDPSLPEKFEQVYDYRHFIIDVELVGHKFHGSYDLKVFFVNEGDEDLVGSVSILGRGDDTRCAACRGRREAGSTLHGDIPVPHDIVVKIIDENNLDNDNVSDEDLAQAITGRLRARLVLGDGTTLASAGGGGLGSPLPSESHPKLRLISAKVSAPRDDENAIFPDKPFEFYGWTDHGSFLTGGWLSGEA